LIPNQNIPYLVGKIHTDVVPQSILFLNGRKSLASDHRNIYDL